MLHTQHLTHVKPYSPIRKCHYWSFTSLPGIGNTNARLLFLEKKKSDFFPSLKTRADYRCLVWTAEKQQLGYNITSSKNLLLVCRSACICWCMLMHFYLLPITMHPNSSHAPKCHPRPFRTRATNKRSCSISLYSNPWKDTAEFHIMYTFHSFYWTHNWHHNSISGNGISELQVNLVVQSHNHSIIS